MLFIKLMVSQLIKDPFDLIPIIIKFIDIASVTMETVLLYSNFIMYKALARR